MKVDEWLRFFKLHNEKKLFSLSDIIQLTGENTSSLLVQLTRLVKSDVINRCAQEWYENPFSTPTPEEIAMVIRLPSYISMEYALSKQGILSQAVHTLTLITTKLPYTYKTETTDYEYHQIRRPLFWGYTVEGMVKMAEPEKALLDLIYVRCAKSKKISYNQLASLINDMYLNELDKQKLCNYSEKFSSGTKKIVAQLEIL